MSYFTAEYITRTIFDGTAPPSAFDKAAAAIFGRPAPSRPIPLKTALKHLKTQGMSPRALQRVEQVLHSLMADRLHDILIDHTLKNTTFGKDATLSSMVVHNVHWSNNYYLGAGIVSPRIALNAQPKMVQILRDGFKEDLYQSITLAHFLFRKNPSAPTFGGGPGQHG